MDATVTVLLNTHRTAEEWKAYIADATAMEREADATKVDAIIEKGRRIKEFHDDFDRDQNGFGKSWEKACKEIAKHARRTCEEYESIAETFGDSIAIGFLPPNINGLAHLTRAIKTNRKTFDDALAGGEVHPLMSRSSAKALAQRAAMESGGNNQLIALFKAGFTPIQIARKLGMMNGDLRNDTNARIKVARDLRNLGFVTKPKKKGKGKWRAPPPGPSLELQREQQAAAHKAFAETTPTGEERAGLDPLQKVHLHAFRVKQMNDANAATQALALSIANVAAAAKPDAERFMELIDEMLAWVPDKSRKGTGWDIDYAAKARTTLASLDKSLDRAVGRLTALQALVRSRNNTPCDTIK